MDREENPEIIFGRNTVLSFLERRQADSAEDENSKERRQAVAYLKGKREKTGKGGEDTPDISALDSLSQISIDKILLATGSRPDQRLERICTLARELNIPLKSCDRRKLDQLAGPDNRHQGVVAFLSPAEVWQLETFLQKVDLDRAERELSGKSMDGYTIALLDGIEDPHNLGAIIRVAEAAGVKAVLIPQRRSAGLTGVVAKTSAGALATLPVVRVTNLVQAIETLKKTGFWVVGLDAGASESFTQSDLVRPLVVVIGGEGQGIGRLVRQNCDFLVSIPMLGRTESLNASVAAGIFFYEVVRQCGISSS